MTKCNPKWVDSLPPREKLLQQGANTLSDAELLALFLRTGKKGLSVLQFSQQLLNEFGSLHDLMRASYVELSAQKGIGLAKYTQLQGVIEMARRFLHHQLTSAPVFSSPAATYHYLMMLIAQYEREVFAILFLNNQHKLLTNEILFNGTYNCVEVHPREIVRVALKYNASALILAHNHPSGTLQPSQADRDVTKSIQQTCALFNIHILDHIIIVQGGYYSFAEQNIL